MKLSVRSKIVFLIVLSLIVLLIPHVLRYFYHDNLLIGEDSYYNLRLANSINDDKVIPVYDELSYGGRPIVSEIGWVVLLAVNPEVMSRFLPLLLGILSAVLFFLIAKKINSKIAFISTILFIISPGFMYLFSVSTKYAGAVFLGLLGFSLVLSSYYLIGVLSLSLISLFSFWGSIISLFLFMVLSLKERYKKKWFLFAIILSIIFIVFQYLRLESLKFPEFIFFYLRENSYLQTLISDFGSLYGVGFATLILSLIGVYILWRSKHKYLFIYVIALILFVLSVYFSFISFYLNVFIALLGGYGFMVIIDSKWECSLIKKVTIFVIILGLLFSSVSYIERLGSLQPREGVYDAIYYLQRKPGDEVVFSQYKRGLWINYGDKKNLMDSNFFYAPEVKRRFMDSNVLLHTQDIDAAVDILNRYNIKYIWIDRWMKEDLWEGEEELLFLLKYDTKFKKVFDNGVVELWRFKE